MVETYIFTVKRTPKEHSPAREPDSLSAVQKIKHILRDSNNRRCVCTSPPLDPITSQINLFQTLTPYFINYFNIILQPTPRFPKQCFFFICFGQNVVAAAHLLQACYVSSPSPPPGFYYPNSRPIW